MNNMGLLIFDMDGTLVDSMDQHADIFSQILFDLYNIPCNLSKLEYIRTSGQPLDEQFEYVLDCTKNIRNVDVTYLLDQFWLLVDKQKPNLFPETLAVIEQLFEVGYVLIVISGCAPHIVESKMQKTGLKSYFKLMLGTDKNLPNMIKGEGHFDRIRQELNLTSEQFRENSLLIGDSEYDMIIAKKAGLLSVGRITHENKNELKLAGANFLINNLVDLTKILRHKEIFNMTFKPIVEIRSTVYEFTFP